MLKVFTILAVFTAGISSQVPAPTIDELTTFAATNQFPHIVAVLGDNGNEFKCSGTIVDEFTVLCTANCVDNKNRTSRETISILAGTNSLILGGVRRNVFIAYIEKDEKFLKNIAMLRLQKPLKFSESIKPAEVSTKKVPDGDEVTIVSWALKLSTSGELLGRTKFYKVKAIEKEKCGHPKNATIVCLGDLEGKNQVVAASSVCLVRFKLNLPFSIFRKIHQIHFPFSIFQHFHFPENLASLSFHTFHTDSLIFD